MAKSAYVYPGARYLDVFDDDMYAWADSAHTDRFAKHLEAVRLHVLFSILFDGHVIVPEQWAASSPTFALVASEVVKPWLRRRRGRELSRETRRPPIVPAFFEGQVRGDEPFLDTMIRRLASEEAGGSPVRISPRLDFEKKGYDAGARHQLRELLVEEARKPTRSDRFDEYFREGTYDVFGGELFADAFCDLCSYFSSIYRDKIEYRQEEYNSHLLSTVRSVDAVTAGPNDELEQIDSGRKRAFQEFFDRVRKENVELSHLSALRRCAAGLDRPAQESILHVGRYCLHRSLANVCGSELSSLMYHLYEPRSPDGFDLTVVDHVRAREVERAPKAEDVLARLRPRGNRAVATLDSIEQIAFESGATPDLTPLGWRDTWEALWALLTEPEWISARDRLRKKLWEIEGNKFVRDPDNWRGYVLEEWDALFGLATDKLKVVHFVRHPDDMRFVNTSIKWAGRLADGAAIATAATGLATALATALVSPIIALATAGVLVVSLGSKVILSAVRTETKADLEVKAVRLKQWSKGAGL